MSYTGDSKLWEEAYKSYKTKVQPRSLGLEKSEFKKQMLRQKWVTTTRDFYRWKKTDEYQAWRRKQFAKQDGKCYYCQRPLKRLKTNVEHVLARSKGGSNDIKNLVLACWECNKKKGARKLPAKELKAYKKIHRKKQSAYWKGVQSETTLALELRDMFRED